MNQLHVDKIASDFSKEDFELVVSELRTIHLDHMMEKSQTNLENTITAILKLSNGDLNKLERLIEASKKDFRDVIYWASEIS